MKQIIDNATGEVIEVEDKNELVEKKLYEVGVVSDEIIDMIEQFKFYEEQYEIFKYKLQQAMKENDIKSWSNDSFVATLKPQSTRVNVDTERLKADGLYDKYLRIVPVKESLQIKFKKRGE